MAGPVEQAWQAWQLLDQPWQNLQIIKPMNQIMTYNEPSVTYNLQF